MNRFLDEAAVRLLAAMILFAPWAFGSTPTWAVWTMNAMGWTLGVVVLARKWVAWREGRQADTPAESQVRVWLVRILAALTVLFLLYVLVSALNYRADYLEFESRFVYRENYIPWLPHSYDVSQTWRALGSYAALAAVFWGVRDYLRPRHGHGTHQREGERGEGAHGRHLSRRLVFLLSLLCLNVGAVALEGIIQRWSGTNKLLWILEPRINNTPESQFGPYAYRANAAQLFNLVWPVCMGLCWAMAETGMARARRVLWCFLLGAALVTAAAPLMTTSRAGAAITVVCLGLLGAAALVTQRGAMRVYWVLGFALLAVGGGLLFGAKPLMARMLRMPHTIPTELAYITLPYSLSLEVTVPQGQTGRRVGVAGVSKSGERLLREPGALSVYFEPNGDLVARINGLGGSAESMAAVPGQLQLSQGRRINITVRIDTNLTLTVTSAGSTPVQANGQGKVSQVGRLPADYLWTGRLFPGQEAHDGIVHTAVLREEGRAAASAHEEAAGYTVYAARTTGGTLHSRIRQYMGNREEVVRNARQMAEDYPWLGSGAGTFVSLYQLYRASTSQTRHAYLHNDWLEFRITLGRMGFGLLLALVVVSFTLPWTQGGIRVPSLLIASLGVAMAGVMLHAIIDFPFQIHSIGLTFVVVAGAMASATGSDGGLRGG